MLFAPTRFLLLASALLSPWLPAQDAAARDLASAQRAFALDLYAELGDETGNLLFSPYSVAVALGMVREGAAGDTAAQMDRVLHTGGSEPGAGYAALAGALEPGAVRDGHGEEARMVDAYRLRVANALWVQNGLSLHVPFLKTLSTAYGAPLQRIDFTRSERARDIINDWVAEHTEQRIEDIVPPGLPTPDTELAIANAIWFKAAWRHPFDEERTTDAPFILAGGERVDVPTMHQTESFRYAATPDARILELPYRGGAMTMVVIVPEGDGGLEGLELDAKRLDAWIAAMKPARVAVAMPGFEFTASLRLGRPLRALGMRDAFDAERADFSGMTDRELVIGPVLHKAFIAVDEDGTEAAAATVVMIKRTSVPSDPIEFAVDRPFWFAIRHRPTGCLLFVGRVADPRAS